MKREKDERKYNFSNPPDELAQHFSKKNPLRTNDSSIFPSKVQNLTVFSIIYVIRIRFFGPGELIQNGFSAAQYVFVNTSADHSPRLSSIAPQGVYLNFNSVTFQVIRYRDLQNWANLCVSYDCEHNTALELLLPQTHTVVRGSIPQCASNWERYTTILKYCVGTTLVSDTFRGQR